MKCPRLLRSSQDTVWPKTNRHSDEIKGGAEAPEDIEEATHDLLQVLISSSCVFSSAALSLPRPVMVIYLVGKGPLFLTGKSSARTRQESSEDGRDRASERTQGGGEYITGARLPGDDDYLPRSSNGTGALATGSERRRRKRKKKNNMSIFVPTGCLDRNRYITFA